MKTILHITECLGSGVLYYIRNLTKWQVDDFNVIVAYSTRPETPDNFKEQFDKRVSFIKVDGFTREIEPRNDLKAFKNIRRIVRETKPDIIHLHSTKAGVIGRWAINCNKYKVFYSPHAYSFLMMDCSQNKRTIYRLIERISDRKGCLTIADSKGELEASKLVTKRSVCIPNGINTEEMDEIIEQAKPLLETFDRPTICMSGKIVQQKNPELFNEIAESLPGYSFIWIGDGPLKEKLCAKNITVTGWLPRSNAIAKIMSSDVFLFTSLWESLSIAIMEVMYLGIPCVVSACDGNKDIIMTNNNGYMCINVSEYVDRINEIIENEELGIRLGTQAKETIISGYSVNNIMNSYSKII